MSNYKTNVNMFSKYGCLLIIALSMLVIFVSNCSVEDERAISADDLYYPMKQIDMLHPDYCSPSGPESEYWKRGYMKGCEDGEYDYMSGTPYASYDLEGYYPRQIGATYRYGYWIGYSSNFPGLKRLSQEEVFEMYKQLND